MKRRITTLIAGALLMFASTAWSYTIGGGATNVGGLDAKLAEDALGDSGAQTEVDWINRKLGERGIITHYTTDDYIKDQTNLAWTPVDGQTSGMEFIQALNLSGTPDYFLIKTGNTHSAFDTYLFQNNVALDWAVIDMQVINAVSFVGKHNTIQITPGKISHVGEASAPVPEPGTMMLLGAGFLGLAVYGKRRKNA